MLCLPDRTDAVRSYLIRDTCFLNLASELVMPTGTPCATTSESQSTKHRPRVDFEASIGSSFVRTLLARRAKCPIDEPLGPVLGRFLG